MAGILDFLTDVGGDRNLSAEFVRVATAPDSTQQDLLDFFQSQNYTEVTRADVDKLFTHRESIMRDFNVPEDADY